jgi:ribosomal protein S18 acetylase RimI-like enzyme
MTSGAVGATIIRHATAADAALLARFAESAFVDTFGSDNTPENMAAYVGEAFGETRQRAEIADPRLTFFLAERQGELAGYAALREGDPPEAVRAALARAGDESTVGAIEILRLYAGRRWLGAGIGSALMQRCLDEAVSRRRRVVWLGVWERNARAIAFYRRWGFTDVGAQPFVLGTDLQTDRIMSRPVLTESACGIR